MTQDTPPQFIKRCRHGPACVGGNATGDGSCSPGYSGPLCAVCGSGFFMDETTFKCMECTDWRKPLITNAVLLVVLLMCAVGLKAQQRHVANVLRSLDDDVRSHLQFTVWASIMPKVKIIAPFLQTISAMSWVYGGHKLFLIREFDALFRMTDRLTLDRRLIGRVTAAARPRNK